MTILIAFLFLMAVLAIAGITNLTPDTHRESTQHPHSFTPAARGIGLRWSPGGSVWIARRGTRRRWRRSISGRCAHMDSPLWLVIPSSKPNPLSIAHVSDVLVISATTASRRSRSALIASVASAFAFCSASFTRSSTVSDPNRSRPSWM